MIKSWTMMELAAWRMYFEVSRPALDALLSIVSDERFSPKDITCHTAQSLINHSRSNLPTLPMSVTELSLTRRQRVKGQQPAGRKLEMGAVEVPIKVPYIPLVSSIIRLFSDPVRAQLMTTRLEPIDHSTTVCSEPNQTPLLNSLRRWSSLICARVQGSEYVVGEFVQLDGSRDVFRLDRLFWGAVPDEDEGDGGC